MALTDDLLAYWDLDEESGVRTDEISSMELVDNNTVLYATGVLTNAADFVDSNSEYLSVADNATLSFGDEDFTIQAWVNLDDVDAHHPIISKRKNSGASVTEYDLLYNDTAERFRFMVAEFGTTNWGAVNADELGVPTPGTWYHIIAYHDAANDLLGIVIDAGAPDTEAYSDGCADGDSPFEIGGRFRSGTPEYLDGKVDEVGIWGRVLTSDERSQLYNSGNGLVYPLTAVFVPKTAWIF